MFVRQTTPNAPVYAQTPASAHSRYPSDASTFSYDDSPNSVLTAGTNITTPPRSPVRQYGQMILPKTRDQDQITEPSAAPLVHRHRKTTSTSSATYSAAYHPYVNSRPASYIRREPSPSDWSSLNTPASVNSPYDAAFNSALNSPLEFGPALDRRPSLTGHARSFSGNVAPGHRRSGSATSLDESVLDRYGYPTYRRMPSYVSASATATTTSQAPPSLNIITAFPSAFPQTEDLGASFTNALQEYRISDLSPAPAVQYPVAVTTTQYDMFAETQPTSSLIEYLTAPNPAPQLVRRVTAHGRINSHYWWDVRNLRSWADFSISKIDSIDGLMPLLQVPIGVNRLPTPARGSLAPDTELGLHDIWSAHFVTKVNAALEVSLPSPMLMRGCRPLPGSRDPDFISNYCTDYEKTLTGDVRGRVVGLVKSYDTWNTGMRVGGPTKQIHYLRGFAHLHRIMREHGCRYGFIMNEIELLCIRCGGPPSAASTDPSTVNSSGSIPLFGYLELSTPIRMSTQGVNPQTGETQMTAGLALWYLHMLAKEEPLPGSMGWRMEVGGPTALTRQNVVERDSWIPKPNMGEKREAKRIRGWVMPEDPYSRKESGRPKRSRRS